MPYFSTFLLSIQLSKAEYFLPCPRNAGVTKLPSKSIPIVCQETPPLSMEMEMTVCRDLSSSLLSNDWLFVYNFFEALHECCEVLLCQGYIIIHVFLLTFSWLLVFQMQLEDLMFILRQGEESSAFSDATRGGSACRG